jgi:serine/threonine protein kinase
MAPEVLTGDAIDPRSDLYALGLVSYQLLTGFNPNCRNASLGSVLGAITEVMLSLEQPLKPPHEVVEGIDPELSRIVYRLLHRDPEGRYSSADAVLADLSYWLYDKGVGPTTGSLASFMQLIRQPRMEPTHRMRRTLQFLAGPDDRLLIHPPWRLLPAAETDVALGINPSRVH